MSATVGQAQLTRLALRRDRVIVPLWVVIAAVVAGSSASAVADVYPTLADRLHAAAGVNATGSLVALYGPIYDPGSEGALALFKTATLGAALVAILSIVLVVRHTRADEEAGRTELLGATVVGRQAPLAAALSLATVTNLALGLATALALGFGGLQRGGALAFGAAWAASGLAFSGVAAVAAQVTRSGRAAVGLSSVVLGAAYLLRAVGDATGSVNDPSWVSWLSPIGWCQQVRPYAGDRWALLVLPVALGGALSAVAFRLSARRDLGGSLIADRPGPRHAARSLTGTIGMAWRLQRGTFISWLVAFVLLGAILGGMAGDVGGLLDSQQAADFIRKLGGNQALSDAFLAAELGFIGVFTSAYAVQAALRLHSEESALRAEPVLAAAVSRTRWMTSHLLVSLLGGLLLLAAAGLAAGSSYAAATGDSGQVPRVLTAALAQAPAVWVLTGIVALGFGIASRAAVIGWGALVGFLLIGELGPLLGMSQGVMDVSPFAHVPKLPGAHFTATPLLWLIALAAALVAAGLVAFRRRDVG